MFEKVLSLPLVLNILCLNSSWICLNMPGYIWISMNMLKYAWICLNRSALFLFYVFSFPHLFNNPFSTSVRGYLFELLQETRRYGPKEHEAVFLKRQNLPEFELVLIMVNFRKNEKRSILPQYFKRARNNVLKTIALYPCYQFVVRYLKEL